MHLFDLPRELRHNIWSYVVPEKIPIKASKPNRSASNTLTTLFDEEGKSSSCQDTVALVNTSRQVRKEMQEQIKISSILLLDLRFLKDDSVAQPFDEDGLAAALTEKLCLRQIARYELTDILAAQTKSPPDSGAVLAQSIVKLDSSNPIAQAKFECNMIFASPQLAASAAGDMLRYLEQTTKQEVISSLDGHTTPIPGNVSVIFGVKSRIIHTAAMPFNLDSNLKYRLIQRPVVMVLWKAVVGSADMLQYSM